jgi:hypothetical protein
MDEVALLQRLIGFVVACGMAVYCLVNGYYGMRFPEKYFKATWTVRRGLKEDPYYAKGAGAITLLVGAILAGMAGMVLQGILVDRR